MISLLVHNICDGFRAFYSFIARAVALLSCPLRKVQTAIETAGTAVVSDHASVDTGLEIAVREFV